MRCGCEEKLKGILVSLISATPSTGVSAKLRISMAVSAACIVAQRKKLCNIPLSTNTLTVPSFSFALMMPRGLIKRGFFACDLDVWMINECVEEDRNDFEVRSQKGRTDDVNAVGVIR